MKKLLTIAIIMLFGLTLFACNKEEPTYSINPEISEQCEEDPKCTVGDESKVNAIDKFADLFDKIRDLFRNKDEEK